jgi:hypothetical protein
VLTTVGQLERNTVIARKDPRFYHYMTVTFPAQYRPIFRSGDIAVYRRAQ